MIPVTEFVDSEKLQAFKCFNFSVLRQFCFLAFCRILGNCDRKIQVIFKQILVKT